MLPSKSGVNWPFGSGEEVKNRFSRWRPSWISDQNNFSYFWSTNHPDASNHVSSQLAQGRKRSRLLKQLLTQHAARPMRDDGHWLTTIAHHEHFMLRWAKNLSKSGSVASEEKSEILKNFPIKMLWGSYKCILKQNWPCRKKVQCEHTTILLAALVDLWPPMICAKIQPQGILGSGEEGFYHIWEWWPFWSTDRDNFSNLLFSHPKVAPCEIWTKLAQWLQRRSNLKFSTIFLFKCMGLIQMHKEANLTMP